MEKVASPTKFTNLQLELLKLYSMNLTDEELMEIKSLLAKYFMKKAIAGANQVWDEKGYSNELMDEWLKTKMRRRA